MNNLRNLLPLLYDFYLVAKNKSFSKAAQDNNMSQSNLSRSVQNLEEEIKLKLIISNNKGIALTIDGEKLYKKLDILFNNLDEKDILQNNNTINGTITIGTTRNIADNKLSFYLTKFHQKYPNIKIKIITDSASNLNEYLVNHKIDVLIDYLQQINSSEKYELEIKAIGNFETFFACSKEFYKAEAFKIKNLKDLQTFNLVIPGSSRRKQALDSILQPLNINLIPIAEMPDSKLMADFIKENDCIGYFVKEEIEAYDLQILPLEEEMPLNHIGIIYAKNTINAITKEFVELILKGSKKDYE